MKTSVSIRLTAVWLFCMFVATLAPFNFVGSQAIEADRLFQYGPYQQQGLDFVLNLLLFMPLGALLQREARARSAASPLVVVLAGVMALFLSLTVEYLQVFLPSRDSSIIDVVSNTRAH